MDSFESVSLTILVIETVSATAGGPNLLMDIVPVAPEGLSVVRLIERREGWVRLAIEELSVRLVFWVPEQHVEFVSEEAEGAEGRRFFAVVNLSPSSTSTSQVELDRGTPIFDSQTGAVFGVMLRDGFVRWCGGEADDASVEVCISTNWGDVRGSVTCPCEIWRGSGE